MRKAETKQCPRCIAAWAVKMQEHAVSEADKLLSMTAEQCWGYQAPPSPTLPSAAGLEEEVVANIDQRGKIHVRYKCRCRIVACGFEYQFEHTDKVEIEKPKEK